MKDAPNQAAAGKAAGALPFQFETPWRGLPEPHRSAQGLLAIGFRETILALCPLNCH